MYPRILKKKLVSNSAKFPVVTVVGPRQSGKSTLIRGCFPEKTYVNLEASRDAEFATSDPIGFLNQFPNGAILDEIQKVPHLLSDIQVIVDERKMKGMFILSGSENLLFSNSIAQSLAGRSIVLKLLPLSLSESSVFPLKAPHVDDVLYHGFYPRIYNDQLNPSDTYGAYVETYVERDVRNILKIKNISQFRKFIELCAGRVGQLFNKASLASEVGVSQPTIEEWISILEATYICFRLPPWHSNLSKRLVKTPKLYFYDVGLASYLIGVDQVRQIKTHPLRGNLFENLQISEVYKFLSHHHKPHRIYFYRDSHGNEVDLLIQRGDKIIPIEIKSAQTFHPSLAKGLEKFRGLKVEVEDSGIVMGSDTGQRRTTMELIAWNKLEDFLERSFAE